MLTSLAQTEQLMCTKLLASVILIIIDRLNNFALGLSEAACQIGPGSDGNREAFDDSAADRDPSPPFSRRLVISKRSRGQCILCIYDDLSNQ